MATNGTLVETLHNSIFFFLEKDYILLQLRRMRNLNGIKFSLFV